MKLYHIQYDGESYYVEAGNLPSAVGLWKLHVKGLWGDDFTGDEEPESIALVHEGDVIRPLHIKPRPTIVCLCGSSQYIDRIAIKSWELEKKGFIVLGMNLLPQNYPGVQEHHQAEAEGIRAHMDELHLRKIDLADQVFVMNVNGYIGQSTMAEIIYASRQGKRVRFEYPALVPKALLKEHGIAV